MGCNSSKRIKATVDVYKPAPASFAVFDINSIQEPWLMATNTEPEFDEKPKPKPVPDPLLDKLDTLEATDAPKSWAEVSKALEDLKPTINPTAAKPPSTTAQTPPSPPENPDIAPQKRQTPRKSLSFHTVEELDAKLTPQPKPNPNPNPNTKPNELRKTESMPSESKNLEIKRNESKVEEGIKPIRENIFLVRDRLEKEKEGKQSNFDKMVSLWKNPLIEYPEKCPPGGNDAVVIYTTSLGGVRRTFEDCNKVRDLLELHQVVYDERDVSLHGEFLNELKELLGVGVTVPTVFVKGRYLGGKEAVVELNELGRLRRILNAARVERGVGRQSCEGCGGARFVPCLDCGGSCKVVIDGENRKERCPKCNENGLVHCPACL